MHKILSSCSLIHCILEDLEVKYWEPPFINDDEACYKYGENHRYSLAGRGLQLQLQTFMLDRKAAIEIGIYFRIVKFSE